MAFITSPQRADHAPAPDSRWALFLDIDGTLLDIAATPDEVRVPDTLTHSLLQASTWLGGALAVVSGRPFAQIDRLLSPLRLPGGAAHGACIRMPNGTMEAASDALAVPDAWRTLLNNAVQMWPGVVVEDKHHCVAVHYRTAPERKEDVEELVTRLAAQDKRNFEALHARMAFEIRNRTLTKAVVVRSLMRHTPFKGRIPVFIGDDVTDHDGFRAVEEKGGVALDVGIAFGGQPAAVREWLEHFRDETN